MSVMTNDEGVLVGNGPSVSEDVVVQVAVLSVVVLVVFVVGSPSSEQADNMGATIIEKPSFLKNSFRSIGVSFYLETRKLASSPVLNGRTNWCIDSGRDCVDGERSATGNRI